MAVQKKHHVEDKRTDPFIKGCFRASILMPEGYVIIIFPRKNGCLMVHP